MIFEKLYQSAKRGELILVNSGICNWHLRRDGQLTITEIIVLPGCQGQGIGTKILDELKQKKPKSIFAKCPADLESNKWYKKKGFQLEKIEQTKSGREINCWRLVLSEPQLKLF